MDKLYYDSHGNLFYFARLIRAFRIIKIFRFLEKLEFLNKLINSLSYSFQELLGIFTLFVTSIYSFAFLGILIIFHW